MKRCYVGLAASFHDAAIAILGEDGSPLFAEAIERPLQSKRAYNAAPDDMVRVPELIAQFCPGEAEIVVATSWSDDQLARLDLVAQSFHRYRSAPDDGEGWPFPHPMALFATARNSLSQAGLNLIYSRHVPNPVSLKRYDHHLTHAATAVYTSPFEECLVAVVDGYGEGASASFFHARDGVLRPVPSTRRAGGSSVPRQPASLGFFYAQLCALCGFDPVKGEEWKVMGLAPYGRLDREIYELLRPMLSVDDLDLVPGCAPGEMARRVRKARTRRRPRDAPPSEAADLACTGQAVFQEVMTELLQNLHRRGLSDNLALAGGCALNSSYNGRIVSGTGFQRLHVPSAPSDDGNCLGAAFLSYCDDHVGDRATPRALSPYLGSELSEQTLARLVRYGGLDVVSHRPCELVDAVAAFLAAGKIVGWVQGRAEFGPRALGNRSILADPRAPDMQDRMNRRVKFREGFRPFAPSILAEHGAEYFEDFQPSPHMERTLHVRPEKRALVPAVVHVDGTARVHSVSRTRNERFYDLVKAFHSRTGVPLVLNTSFNIMGRPLVHSTEDALGMFFTSGLDALVLHNLVIEKKG
jgi:carbamoyltransferase